MPQKTAGELIPMTFKLSQRTHDQIKNLADDYGSQSAVVAFAVSDLTATHASYKKTLKRVGQGKKRARK